MFLIETKLFYTENFSSFYVEVPIHVIEENYDQKQFYINDYFIIKILKLQ